MEPTNLNPCLVSDDQRCRRRRIILIRQSFYSFMLACALLNAPRATCFRIVKPIQRENVQCDKKSLIRRFCTSDTILCPAKCLFDVETPEGRCVALQIEDFPKDNCNALTIENVESPNHWIHANLHPDEIQFGKTLGMRAPSFWMGRLALRYVLENPPCSILKDSYGRPIMPSGYLGSISHKTSTGAALVAPWSNQTGIGIDIEETRTDRRNVSRFVLTPNERNNLGHLAPDVSSEEEVFLRFSLKECLYKAMHPLICQYVGFQEAEVWPLRNGSAQVDLMLKSGAHHKLRNISAHWRRTGDYFLCTARVQLRDGELHTQSDDCAT